MQWLNILSQMHNIHIGYFQDCFKENVGAKYMGYN
jgi:hypothetical protein